MQILAYADDIISRSPKSLQEATIKLDRAARRMGLEIKQAKTKYMICGTEKKYVENVFKVKHMTFERVNSFVYLGTLITTDNNTSAEINNRITLANRSYFGLVNILKAKNINKKYKVIIYKTLIKPVLVYGAETWVLSKANDLSLGDFERKILRRIYRPICERATWRSRYNEELYRLYETDLVTIIRITWLRQQDIQYECKIIYHIRKSPWTSRRAEGECESQTSDGWMDGVMQRGWELEIGGLRPRTDGLRRLLELAKTLHGKIYPKSYSVLNDSYFKEFVY